MKISLFFAVSIFFAIQTISQAQGDFRPGYIIKADGDSISGLAAYQNKKHSGKYCLFKKGKNQKAIKYLPTEISAYGFFEDKRFESRELYPDSVVKNNIFLEVLVKGNMSLYRYETTFYVDKGKLLKLPQREDEIVDTKAGLKNRKDTRYIGILNYLLSECELTANNTRYDEHEILNLIQNFNRCKGVAGEVYKSKKSWTKLNYQVIGGLNISSLGIVDLANVTFKSYSPVFGASIDFSSPRINDKILFGLEMDYQKDSYSAYKQYVKNSNSVDRYNYHIDVNYLKIPISFRYNFLDESMTPYVRIGFEKLVTLKSSSTLLTEHERTGVVNTEFANLSFSETSQYGYWFALGFGKTIRNRYKGFIEVRYERTNGFVKGYYIQAATYSEKINILCGFRF